VGAIAKDEVGPHYGSMAPFMAIDGRASSTLTQELLSWKPVGTGLIEDLEQGHYFEVARTQAAA
jgi:hypothetical protein